MTLTFLPGKVVSLNTVVHLAGPALAAADRGDGREMKISTE